MTRQQAFQDWSNDEISEKEFRRRFEAAPPAEPIAATGVATMAEWKTIDQDPYTFDEPQYTNEHGTWSSVIRCDGEPCHLIDQLFSRDAAVEHARQWIAERLELDQAGGRTY